MKYLLLTLISIAPLAARGQDQMNRPMHQESSEQHAAGVDRRGDHAMGFSHGSTKHHFKLLPDGGIIQIDANNPDDTKTKNQIRGHLSHIAIMFSANDFEVPMFIHHTIPPGVPMMKEKHGAITYTFVATARGAQVKIETHDPDALKAVHEFLRFQINDHRSGDSAAIKQVN